MIDYIFKFASEAAAKTAARNADKSVDGDWLTDHVTPGITVTRISTGNPIAGFFMLVSTNERVPVLEAATQLQVACDREKAAAGQPFILINNVGAILADIYFSPVPLGSAYPFGGYN